MNEWMKSYIAQNQTILCFLVHVCLFISGWVSIKYKWLSVVVLMAEWLGVAVLMAEWLGVAVLMAASSHCHIE